MQQNTLYAVFWAAAASVVMSIVFGITYYNVQETELAAKSNSPALFECGLSSERQKTAFCVNLSQQHN